MSAAGMIAGGVMNTLGLFGSMAGTTIKTAYNMMPNTQATIGRETGFYNAAVMQGNGATRQGMRNATFGAMYGGMTSAGSDQMVGEYLSSRGMAFNKSANSSYMQTVRSVSNAAKYMNMSNERATVAIEDLTSGKQSKNLMQNLGIYTSDLGTGKAKTQGQIFSEIADRLTAGRQGVSEDQINESFRRGNLGASLEGLGLSGDQQQMMKQFLIERSKGNYMDLSNDQQMAELQKKAGINPAQAGMMSNTFDTRAMNDAAEAYIKGMNNAVPMLDELSKVSGTLAKNFGEYKAFFDTISGSNAGKALIDGVSEAIGNFTNAVTTAIGLLMAALAGGGLGGGGFLGGGRGGKGGEKTPVSSPGTTSKKQPSSGYFNKNKPSGGAKPGGFKMPKLGKAAGIIGIGLTAADLIGDIASGDGWGSDQFSEDLGAGIGGTIGGILGAFGGPAGSFAGAYAGAEAGRFFGSHWNAKETAVSRSSRARAAAAKKAGLVPVGRGAYGKPTGGPSSTISTGNSTGSAANAGKITFIYPINGAKITDGYGPRQAPTAGASTFHRGIDFGAAQGTPIMASAQGTVTMAGDNGGLGNCVKIKHPNGITTVYGHQSRLGTTVGREVKQGQIIGYVGSTGTSTGPHLHFETHDESGNAFDPMKVLSGNGSPISGDAANGQHTTAGGGSAGPALTAVIDQRAKEKGPSLQGLRMGANSGQAMATATPQGGSVLSGMMGGVMGGRSVQTGMSDNPNILTNNRMSGYLAGARRAKGGDPYVAQDGPVNVHAGEAILTSEQAEVWRTALKQGGLGKRGGNNVTINLTIGQASDSEAKRFAGIVKEMLESDRMIEKMGRM
jgi:murein DD-endopeptidase MepM/ murein hydrolase activator NlpD